MKIVSIPRPNLPKLAPSSGKYVLVLQAQRDDVLSQARVSLSQEWGKWDQEESARVLWMQVPLSILHII